MNKKHSKLISIYYFLSIAIILAGYGFYIVVRGFEPLFNIDLGNPVWSVFPLYIKNSFATFTHVLAFSLFSYALLGAKQKFKLAIILFWALSNTGFELLQLSGVSQFLTLNAFSGTFDVGDIVAIVFAVVVYFAITGLLDSKFHTSTSPKTEKINRYSHSGLSLVVLFGVWSILACGGGYGYDAGYTDYQPDEPIYLSYDELRAPLTIDTQRELQESGKIYIYQNLLLVSEPNKGIHIFDNSIPAKPDHIAFIKLPGNLDVAVRNGYLYADSFIDLVVININDLNNIYEISRVPSAFPYDPYQAIPQNERTFYQWDDSNGVIIGVKQNASTTITNKIFI